MAKKPKIEWDAATQEFMKRVGGNMRKRRKEIGKTLITIAKEVGLSQPTMTQIELGNREFLASYLPKFAKALNIKPENLITG